jgi:hypothetical protein
VEWKIIHSAENDGMRDLFFDQSRRPVRTVDFDFDALDGGEGTDQRLKDRLAISEFFWQRYRWILAGRTQRSREVRRAIVQGEIDGIKLTAIARRFGVTRQAVYRQFLSLRKLTRLS